MSYMPIQETAYALKEYYASAEETEKVILNAALVAAGADAVGGAIPGVSIPITIITCTGAVWVMYGALCKTLGISMKKNVLKLAKQSNNPYDLSGISADDMKRTMKDIPVSGEDLEAPRRVYEVHRGHQD